MKPVLFLASFQYLKTGLYSKIEHHPNRARLLCVPIAAQSFVSYPLLAAALVIEALVMSIINIVGLIRGSQNATLKDLAISLSVIGIAPALIPLSLVIGAITTTITLFGCAIAPVQFGSFAHRFHEKGLIE